MKTLPWLSVILLALLGFLIQTPAHAQASCSSSYDSTKKYCTAVEKTLEKIAETTASEFLKRGIPVFNVIKTVHDVYGAATCTVDCVKR